MVVTRYLEHYEFRLSQLKTLAEREDFIAFSASYRISDAFPFTASTPSTPSMDDPRWFIPL